MRVISLYLTSRRASRALLGILGSGVLAWLLLTLSSDPHLIRLIQVVVPLVPAVVIGVSTWSPFGEAEHAASRPIVPMRIVHLGGLLACAAVALGMANLAEPGPDSRWVLVRNLAGYTGLAFIGARSFGPAFASTFSWALPLAYTALVWAADDKVGWAWAKQSSTEDSAMLTAITLLAIGLAAILPVGRWGRMNEEDVA